MLFRPPYNADSQPQTPEEILPVLRAQKAGYVTVGERIDPRDWAKDVTADEIVSEIRASSNEDNPGHVILLHDAGGDRSATVAALPRILDALQARGLPLRSAQRIARPDARAGHARAFQSRRCAGRASKARLSIRRAISRS